MVSKKAQVNFELLFAVRRTEAAAHVERCLCRSRREDGTIGRSGEVAETSQAFQSKYVNNVRGRSGADLIRFLDATNVESRPVWKPMHIQPLCHNYECVGGEVAEDLNRRGICLPSSSCLTEEEQQFVIERVREAVRR